MDVIKHDGDVVITVRSGLFMVEAKRMPFKKERK